MSGENEDTVDKVNHVYDLIADARAYVIALRTMALKAAGADNDPYYDFASMLKPLEDGLERIEKEADNVESRLINNSGR